MVCGRVGGDRAVGDFAQFRYQTSPASNISPVSDKQAIVECAVKSAMNPGAMRCASTLIGGIPNRDAVRYDRVQVPARRAAVGQDV
jgi:hypothetical protein